MKLNELTITETITRPNPLLLQILAARVKRGRDLLVKRFGLAYIDKINPDRLYMDSSQSCVLGQLFGQYVEGVRKILRVKPEPHIAQTTSEGAWAINHGFFAANLDGVPNDPEIEVGAPGYSYTYIYAQLGDLWKEQFKRDDQKRKALRKKKPTR